MLTKEIMTPKDKLIIASPMDSVRDALRMMKTHGVRSIIVDKKHPAGAYGLLTYKNVLQSIVAEDGDIDLLNVYDIASSPAFSVSQELDVRYSAQLMVNASIKRLLVIDNNELHGILTMTNIIEILIENVES